MALLTLTDARKLMGRGRPWTLRMEFRGQTSAGNPSAKFWLATGRSRHEPVEVHYGVLGAKPHILVKGWDYLEGKVPEKLAKGYTYVSTPYMRIRPEVLVAFTRGGMAAALAYGSKAAPPQPPTVRPTGVDYWRCDAGGVTITIKHSMIVIVFDKFPADWQGASYSGFKGHLASFCSGNLGSPVPVTWSGDHGEIFTIHSIDGGLFNALVTWFQGKIGPAASPLMPPPKLNGPYARVTEVMSMGGGVWHALDKFGSKVLTLTSGGSRDLVSEYPHITVTGL